MHETEAETRVNRIDPVLREAGWGVVEGAQVHRELICPGRILAGGGRAVSALPAPLPNAISRLRLIRSINPIAADGRKHTRPQRASTDPV
jgi:hypothetical protein